MSQNQFTILMADDDPEDIEMVEEAIAGIDPELEIYKVFNGKAALEYLNNQPDDKLPCLIILDYNMPELNGSEVLSSICGQKRYADIPRIILSISNAPLHISECKRNGATEYFVKPNNMAGFTELAKKMLNYCKNVPRLS
jgi:CheY-like chemotaxis protein